MRWTDVTADWSFWGQIIRNRFPQLSQKELDLAVTDRSMFEAELARSHHLSLNEAREEIDDLIFVQTLAREVMASEYHAGVAASA
ncbi:MAG: hypothetical protein AB3N11_17880 [Arenibacterium sp.]